MTGFQVSINRKVGKNRDKNLEKVVKSRDYRFKKVGKNFLTSVNDIFKK